MSIAENPARSAQLRKSLRLWRNGMQTTFVGLDAVRKIEYRTTRNEDTRCHFCKNNCLRTFIDIRTEPEVRPQLRAASEKVTKVPLMHGEQRLIIATCEKGTVEDVNDMKDIKAGLDQIKDATSELRRHGRARSLPSNECQERRGPDPRDARLDEIGERTRAQLMQKDARPAGRHPARVEHLHLCAAVQRYLESLGVQPENIIYSDYTSSGLYRREPAAAQSTPVSRRRSESRTSTT